MKRLTGWRGLIRFNTRKLTKSRRNKDSQIDSSFLIFSGGGAWPFSVDGVLCLVKPVNARVLSLLNRVKYDSSFISFSALWQFNSFLISANYFSIQLNFFGYAVTGSKFSELFSYAATVFSWN